VNRLRASSMSRSVREQMENPPFVGRVVAVFARACMIASPAGRVVSIVGSELGDGPLNIVLDDPSFSFHGIPQRGRAWVEDSRLCAEGLVVDTTGAVIWEPRPDWSRLRAHRAAMAGNLPMLRSYALGRAPEGSLLPLVADRVTPPEQANPIFPVLQAARRAALSLRIAFSKGQPGRLASATSLLAGLGSGLTPAGDDFLAGVMLRAWLEHPAPEPLCRNVVRAAAPHTSVLSTAFLRAASCGECNAPWHRLLRTLANGHAQSIRQAARRVLSFGHTSGADTLAGFLWLDSVPVRN
jgi:hypothetical protein